MMPILQQKFDQNQKYSPLIISQSKIQLAPRQFRQKTQQSYSPIRSLSDQNKQMILTIKQPTLSIVPERRNKLLPQINNTRFLQKKDSNQNKIENQESKNNVVKSVVIGPGNNSNLIKEYLSKNYPNWKILDYVSNKSYQKFDIKWVQTLFEINWRGFQEGKQILNHIPNIGIWATKNGLYETIIEYEKKNGDQNALNDKINSSKFLPITYRLDIANEEYIKDEIEFINQKSEGIWIFKPTQQNCGKGIRLINNVQNLKDDFQRLKKISKQIKEGRDFQSEYFSKYTKKSILQRYIEHPLLLENRKFDLRVYVLIASTKPFFVLFHHGYVRLSIQSYRLDGVEKQDQKCTHLTNAFVQKKHPNFEQQKETTIWSMEKFEDYLISFYNKDQNFLKQLYTQIKQILCYVIRCGQEKIEKKLGLFELMGCDILIDENFQPYLLEMNLNPALWLDTKSQAEIIPKVVNSVLDIVLKINNQKLDQTRRQYEFSQNELKLGSFQVLIDEQQNQYFI